MSFVFRLVAQDEDAAPAIVFQDSVSPGYVPLWEAVGVYEALYNSDGRAAREISRALAFGADKLADDASLGRLLPVSCRMSEAVRFLENVLRGCTTHGAARIETR